MAGAVGIEVISPMPMAPKATSTPGFSTIMLSISGALSARNSPRVPNLAVGTQSFKGYCSVSA